MKIIQRKQAKDNRVKFYFTGKPCKHGHVAKRRTVNSECVECAQNERNKNQTKRTKRFIETHGSEYSKQKSKQHYKDHKQQYVDRAVKWTKENSEKIKPGRDKRNKKFRKENPEYSSNWWKENKDKSQRYSKRDYTKASRKKWNTNNKGKKNHYTRLRQQQISQATPTWAELEKIKLIYVEAANLTKQTGIPHEVDHIVPLAGKIVCGLHIAENLQILTKTKHKFKLNKFT